MEIAAIAGQKILLSGRASSRQAESLGLQVVRISGNAIEA
jgi:hypothetical protein